MEIARWRRHMPLWKLHEVINCCRGNVANAFLSLCFVVTVTRIPSYSCMVRQFSRWLRPKLSLAPRLRPPQSGLSYCGDMWLRSLGDSNDSDCSFFSFISDRVWVEGACSLRVIFGILCSIDLDWDLGDLDPEMPSLWTSFCWLRWLFRTPLQSMPRGALCLVRQILWEPNRGPWSCKARHRKALQSQRAAGS